MAFLADWVFKVSEFLVAKLQKTSKVMHIGKYYFDPLHVS